MICIEIRSVGRSLNFIQINLHCLERIRGQRRVVSQSIVSDGESNSRRFECARFDSLNFDLMFIFAFRPINWNLRRHLVVHPLNRMRRMQYSKETLINKMPRLAVIIIRRITIKCQSLIMRNMSSNEQRNSKK